MHRIMAVTAREYSTRIRTMRFILGTILTPLLMAAWIMAPNYFASKAKSAREVIVLDETGNATLFETIGALLKNDGEISARRGVPGLDVGYPLTRQAVRDSGEIVKARESIETAPKTGVEKALLILHADAVEGVIPTYVGTSLSDPSLPRFEQTVQAAILRWKLTGTGLAGSDVESLVRSAPMKIERMKATGLVSGDDAESVAIFMLVTMYTVTFMYGVWMMRGVAMEKRTRIAEVLLTIAKPVELMAGKLAGIGLVGLTQCFLWVLAAAFLNYTAFDALKYLGVEIPRLNGEMLGYFLVYFILGYFLYAVLFALAGASSTNTDDANFIQQPLIVLTVVPMLVFFVVLRDPSGVASVVLSMIPFFAPTLMILRLAISEPPMWQIAGSFAIMIATIAISVLVTAKVYRAGILMSGSRQSFASLVRSLRYA